MFKFNGIKSNVIIYTTMVFIFAATINIFMYSNSFGDTSYTSKRLMLLHWFILKAYYKDNLVEVKRLKIKGGHFYGYGWLDNDRVFVAYQDEGSAAAVAILEIIDLRDSNVTTLTRIGGVGEARFDVNKSTGEVIYITGNEIKLIKINPNTGSYRDFPIIKNVKCWYVFWTDANTVGCSRKNILTKHVIHKKQ